MKLIILTTATGVCHTGCLLLTCLAIAVSVAIDL